MTDNAYMKNAQGHLVPADMVKEIDKLRDELVMRTIARAHDLNHMMQAFKRDVQQEVEAFIELSAQEYGCKIGGGKGNVTLSSYDGHYKVLRANSDFISFDERLQVAKELIDNCIKRWAENAGSEIKALVSHAFQTDSAGKINTGRVLGLTKLNITDTEWLHAMQAIRDSVQVSGSKTYFRLYERVGNSDDFRQIPLDIASV